MKCKNCNGTLRSTSIFCPNCGTKVEKEEEKETKVKVEEQPKEEKKQEVPKSTTVNNTSANEESTIGWGILGFFIPLVGIILFFVWLNDRPKASKASGIGALIRIVLSILIIIFMFVFIFASSCNYVEKTIPSYNYNNDYYDDYNYYWD